jgi:hypothetical protein
MFDNLISHICAITALGGSCNSSITAFSVQNHIKQDLDQSESEFVKEYTKKTYKLLGKQTVEYTVAVGFITDSIVEKRIQINTPFKPIAHDLQLNADTNGYRVGLNWKWNLE